MLRPGDIFDTSFMKNKAPKTQEKPSVNLNDLHQTEGQPVAREAQIWPGHREDPGLPSSWAIGLLRGTPSSGRVVTTLTLH